MSTMTTLSKRDYPVCEECGFLVVTGQRYLTVLVRPMNAPPEWGIAHESCLSAREAAQEKPQ